MKNPWLKFYTSDWRSDPALRMCSVAARGLWVEMICLMHEADPYGHLLVNGLEIDFKQLAALAGCPVRECVNALAELGSCGVLSKTSEGRIFSRRMVRDRERANKDRENGGLGGNPRLNGGVNPEDKAQKPEARSHIPEKKDRPRKRGKTELPENWKPGQDTTDRAKSLGLSDSDLVRERERFENHARQNARTAVNWDAAFRNWCIKAAELLGRQPRESSSLAGFVAPPHSPQFLAWKAHAQDRGHAALHRMLVQREEENRGFNFEAEWPPGYKGVSNGASAKTECAA